MATVKALILAASIAHGVNPAAMDTLVNCETGGTYYPRIVSSDGAYVGLTQLSYRHRLAMRAWALRQGLEPDDFDPAQQLNYSLDYIVTNGAGEWPTCGWRFR